MRSTPFLQHLDDAPAHLSRLFTIHTMPTAGYRQRLRIAYGRLRQQCKPFTLRLRSVQAIHHSPTPPDI